MKKNFRTLTLALTATVALSACSAADRIANIGEAPQLEGIQDPTTEKDYRPVSLPMPMPQHAEQKQNSLWQANRQTFFKDQRASQVGDILTVFIEIDDEAELTNETERTRSSSEDADLPALLGYEQALDRVLPQAVDPADLTQFGSSSSSTGEGTTEREEEISLKVAALITQVLPNGNLVIMGRQEVRVNFEKRILQIAGVVRPEDILSDNSISYEKIAEARIAYGGEGQITDMQQPRYGQQLYDILFPF